MLHQRCHVTMHVDIELHKLERPESKENNKKSVGFAHLRQWLNIGHGEQTVGGAMVTEWCRLAELRWC